MARSLASMNVLSLPQLTSSTASQFDTKVREVVAILFISFSDRRDAFEKGGVYIGWCSLRHFLVPWKSMANMVRLGRLADRTVLDLGTSFILKSWVDMAINCSCSGCIVLIQRRQHSFRGKRDDYPNGPLRYGTGCPLWVAWKRGSKQKGKDRPRNAFASEKITRRRE